MSIQVQHLPRYTEIVKSPLMHPSAGAGIALILSTVFSDVKERRQKRPF